METGSVVVLFLCLEVPCPFCPEKKKTVLALCAKVLKTLCLAVMWWLLSQCKY